MSYSCFAFQELCDVVKKHWVCLTGQSGNFDVDRTEEREHTEHIETLAATESRKRIYTETAEYQGAEAERGPAWRTT